MIHLLLIVELVLVAGLIPWFALLGAVLLAAVGRRLVDGGGAGMATEPTAQFLIVIPAHDEAEVIAVTVASCLRVDYAPGRYQVCVIADNCTDATAAVAEAAGAHVVVRVDPARRSKGYALADFFDDVANDPLIRPFDAYVLVDADTSVAPDLLRAFDQSLRRGDDFVQGYYGVRNADASWRTRMMTYAFSLANGVWLVGTDALGLSVGLKGNGMCFRADALARFPWRVHGLVEDMEFAWALRVGGERVRFQPRARVYGEMVSRGGAGAASQRRRWESGRQALRASVRPRLWESPHLSVGQKVAGQVELNFPPLSRLVLGLLVASALATWGAWQSSGQEIWLVIGAILITAWGLLLAYALSPLLIMGLPVRFLLSLIHLPYYMAWKLTLGRRRRPDLWIRTPRESGPTPSDISLKK